MIYRNSRNPVAKSQTADPLELDTGKITNASFLLFVAGVIIGLLQLMYPVSFGDGYEMVTIAKNLAAKGAFADPFYVQNTGPTATQPPLYPFLLALLFKFLRAPELVVLAAAVGSIIMNALTASWLPRVSLLFFGNSFSGIVAGAFWLAAVQLIPSWDTSYTVAGTTLFCICSASSLDKTPVNRCEAAVGGAVAGLIVLLNPASLLILLPWVIYLILRRKTLRRQTAVFCSILLGVCSLIVSLWMLRNYHQLQAPVVRIGLGITLHESNNDCAKSSLLENMRSGCHQTHHPNRSLSEANALQAMGEAHYERSRLATAINWMIDHPDRLRHLTLRRFREFWFPPVGYPAYSTYAIWLATVLSIPGFILMVRRRERAALFLGAVLALYPLVYYLVVTDVRYRYPVLWLSLLSAGYFIACLVGTASRRTTASRKPGSQLVTY